MKNNKFLSIEDIPLNSLWKAADGENYGYIVMCKDITSGNISCLETDAKGKHESIGTYRDINWYKLQYRYCLVENAL